MFRNFIAVLILMIAGIFLIGCDNQQAEGNTTVKVDTVKVAVHDTVPAQFYFNKVRVNQTGNTMTELFLGRGQITIGAWSPDHRGEADLDRTPSVVYYDLLLQCGRERIEVGRITKLGSINLVRKGGGKIVFSDLESMAQEIQGAKATFVIKRSENFAVDKPASVIEAYIELES